MLPDWHFHALSIPAQHAGRSPDSTSCTLLLKLALWGGISGVLLSQNNKGQSSSPLTLHCQAQHQTMSPRFHIHAVILNASRGGEATIALLILQLFCLS